MKSKILLASFLLLPGFSSAQSPPVSDSQVPVTFIGGYETDPRDHGRPVILIAAALKVPAEVFRETFSFSHVRPAPGGQEPDPAQVRKNKEALLAGLGPYGVTNDRLDTVSNYYRYRPGDGSLWRHTPATAVATVHDGVVTSLKITNAGSGYSSTPVISVKGFPNISGKVTLSYGVELESNGSIAKIEATDR